LNEDVKMIENYTLFRRRRSDGARKQKALIQKVLEGEET
jgi:hypothetical protein